MDLVNVMNIVNELYSGLSSLSRESYLLLTEVPEMVMVFNINYQLQYSPSYTDTIHGTCEVQDFNYCVSFANTDTRSITILDPKDPVPFRYLSYPAHRV